MFSFLSVPWQVILPVMEWEEHNLSRPLLAFVAVACMSLFPIVMLPTGPSMWLLGIVFNYFWGFCFIMIGAFFGQSLPYAFGHWLMHDRVQVHHCLQPTRLSLIVASALDPDPLHCDGAVSFHGALVEVPLAEASAAAVNNPLIFALLSAVSHPRLLFSPLSPLWHRPAVSFETKEECICVFFSPLWDLPVRPQSWLSSSSRLTAVLRLADSGGWFQQFKTTLFLRMSPFPYLLFNCTSPASQSTSRFPQDLGLWGCFLQPRWDLAHLCRVQWYGAHGALFDLWAESSFFSDS